MKLLAIALAVVVSQGSAFASDKTCEELLDADAEICAKKLNFDAAPVVETSLSDEDQEVRDYLRRAR